MFTCGLCGANVPPRTSAHRVVLETRPVVYPRREKANPPHRKNRHEIGPIDDPGGKGKEIVREVLACPMCASSDSP